MQVRIQHYVAFICIAAIAALSALYIAGSAATSAQIISALLMASLGLASNMLAYELPNGAIGSIAFVPFAAAVLLCPNWVAPLAIASAVLGEHALTRRGIMKATFNTGQAILSASVGTIAYRFLGGDSYFAIANGGVDLLVKEYALPSATFLLMFHAINTLTVSGVISLTSGARVREIWRNNTLITLSYSLFSWPAIVLYAYVYVSTGPVWALILSIPILGLRQLYASTIQLRKSNTELLELMVKAIEARDPYTSGHSRRVSQVSTTVARAIGLREREVERVRIAGLLHDVGKIHEDYAPILRKPGKLTADEWELMKTHPDRGADLVSTMSHLSDLVPSIRHHHERWDGKGYPSGIAGDAIPLAARIITIADTLDALTSDRPYRKGLTESEVRQEFVRCRGTQFDPAIIDRVLSGSVWPQLFADDSSHEVTRRLRRAQ